MSLTKRFKTDAEAEKNGFKFRLPANEDGTIPTFYIARRSATNTVFQKALEKASAPYINEMRLGVMDPEIDKQIMREVFVDGKILVGWENILASDVPGYEFKVESAEGQPLPKAPFSRKHALSLLKELPELHDVLNAASMNMNNFLLANREEVAKN